MTASSESKPEQPEELPKFPPVQVMQTWDTEKVLQWIQQRHPNVLVEEDDLNNFKKARIAGRAFLAFSVKHFKACDLPLAVAVALKDLAGEVKDLASEVKEGKLSDQTAGGKRRGDEIDSSELSIPPKRIRQEDPSWESATRAREQRGLIRKFITDLNSSSDQHSKSVHPLPGAVDKLSDPTFEGKLVFPFIGRVPERFKVDNKAEETWPYVGRTKFKELLKELKYVRESLSYSTIWVYGTQGYGKSHLLAALACYLAAQCERVVYLPDCREWLRNDVGYIKIAMLFAWADDITTQEEIEVKTTKAEIEAFFKRQKNVIFVVDQLNALTENSSSMEVNKKRETLNAWLLLLASCHTSHKAVFSSPANYREYLGQAQQQNSNRVVRAYGGFDRAEMDQWWKRHKIDMGGYKQSNVEDVTGCIPLLLDKCIVGGKIDLTVNNLRDIYNKAVSFVQEIRDKTTGHLLKWQWYLDYVTACFSHKSLPSEQHFELIDHRYFYELNGSGRCVCGLVRDAVGEQLLQWGDNFINANSLASLPDLISSPPAVGFLIEHAILSSIQSNGLAINAGIVRPMKVRLLTEPSDIKTDIRDEPVLYWPKRLNFEIIDGIIILINPEELNDEENAKRIAQKRKKTPQGTRAKKKKKTPQGTRTNNTKVERDKLLMFPLQITLARPGHSDSHEKFFENYRKWTKHLSNFDVETQFIWITPSDRNFQTHQSTSKRPAHGERYIPFEDVNAEIWWKYQDAKRAADAARVELTGCSTASGNITADERSSEVTADERSSEVTADKRSSEVTADERSSEVIADERSSSSSEVTAAVSSVGRVSRLRPRRGARQT